MRTCKVCVLDETDPELDLNSEGICRYCRSFEVIKDQLRKNISNQKSYFETLALKLSKAKKSKYDCLIGLSGGVDSSYVCLLAKQQGLNPLLVHFDNGWNSEIAVNNIKKIAKKCEFDLQTYVINWPEFRDLQRSFFKASVIDIEMLTDHAILAALYEIGKKYQLKYMLSGNNYATEFGMPQTWRWNKKDFTNIKAIHKRFGTLKLKTFPVLPSWKWLLIRKFGMGLTYEEPLNHIEYRKKDALEELKKEFEWEYYGGKHYESVFTKFYQAHILPTKFGIDKRKAHLSSLLRNGELTRDEALAELQQPLYEATSLQNEQDYVLKKLGFTIEEFREIMAADPVPHSEYPNDESFLSVVFGANRILRKFLKRK